MSHFHPRSYTAIPHLHPMPDEVSVRTTACFASGAPARHFLIKGGSPAPPNCPMRRLGSCSSCPLVCDRFAVSPESGSPLPPAGGLKVCLAAESRPLPFGRRGIVCSFAPVVRAGHTTGSGGGYACVVPAS